MAKKVNNGQAKFVVPADVKRNPEKLAAWIHETAKAIAQKGKSVVGMGHGEYELPNGQTVYASPGNAVDKIETKLAPLYA